MKYEVREQSIVWVKWKRFILMGGSNSREANLVMTQI